MDFSGSKYAAHSGSTLSQLYHTYRPMYPKEMHDIIISYHKESSKASLDLAVDVACGTGQATLPLAGYFKEVIGLDISRDQLAMAPKHMPNVTYREGPAEDLSFLQDASVDLVTVGTAVHWFNVEVFIKEVDRILKPGGSFVVFNNKSVPGFEHKEANEYIQRFVLDRMIEYGGAERVTFGHEHHELHLITPFKDHRRREDLEIKVDWTLDHLVGFLDSMSHNVDYIDDDSDIHDSVKKTLSDLLSDNGTIANDQKYTITFKVLLSMYRKPL